MMLVIKRRVGEMIQLSDGTVIIITDIQRGRVGVGIHAPKSVIIRRSRPCVVCNLQCFGCYLGYSDVPFCGKVECAVKLRRGKQDVT